MEGIVFGEEAGGQNVNPGKCIGISQFDHHFVFVRGQRFYVQRLAGGSLKKTVWFCNVAVNQFALGNLNINTVVARVQAKFVLSGFKPV